MKNHEKLLCESICENIPNSEHTWNVLGKSQPYPFGNPGGLSVYFIL